MIQSIGVYSARVAMWTHDDSWSSWAFFSWCSFGSWWSNHSWSSLLFFSHSLRVKSCISSSSSSAHFFHRASSLSKDWPTLPLVMFWLLIWRVILLNLLHVPPPRRPLSTCPPLCIYPSLMKMIHHYHWHLNRLHILWWWLLLSKDSVVSWEDDLIIMQIPVLTCIWIDSFDSDSGSQKNSSYSFLFPHLKSCSSRFPFFLFLSPSLPVAPDVTSPLILFLSSFMYRTLVFSTHS